MDFLFSSSSNSSSSSFFSLNSSNLTSESTVAERISAQIFPKSLYARRDTKLNSFSTTSTSTMDTSTSTAYPTAVPPSSYHHPRHFYATHQMNPGLSYFDSMYFIVVTMSTVRRLFYPYTNIKKINCKLLFILRSVMVMSTVVRLWEKFS